MSKCLIIGGSSGIGKEIVLREIENRDVINISRRDPEVSGITHHSVDVITDELPDLEDINSLVYCPGSINLKPISSLSIEDFRSDLEINLIGAVKVIKKYHKILKKADNASIVLFSTVAVAQGMPFHASVSAAKAAVEGLAKTLAAELAPKIRVNCIAPTITDTPLASGILRNEKAVEKMKDRHPLKRILTAGEVADMACYLMSTKAASMSGQIIAMDAGLSSIKN